MPLSAPVTPLAPQPGRQQLSRWLTRCALGAATCLSAWVADISSPTAQVLQGDPTPRSLPTATSGRLSLLTYNVAGLPGWLSPSNPARNTPLASPLLRAYDLVVTQEDWAYHPELIAQTSHPFVEAPSGPSSSFLGDGLSLLSVHRIEPTEHIPWDHCNGYLGDLNDCLADKGFAHTRVWLSAGAHVNLINLHADAGSSVGDSTARHEEFNQLAHYIEEQIDTGALIVAGDTNLEPNHRGDAQINLDFTRRTGLTDICDTLPCARPGIDRVLLRSSEHLRLAARAQKEDPRFFDAQGQPLSDHPALAVIIDWQLAARALTQLHP